MDKVSSSCRRLLNRGHLRQGWLEAAVLMRGGALHMSKRFNVVSAGLLVYWMDDTPSRVEDVATECKAEPLGTDS